MQLLIYIFSTTWSWDWEKEETTSSVQPARVAQVVFCFLTNNMFVDHPYNYKDLFTFEP